MTEWNIGAGWKWLLGGVGVGLVAGVVSLYVMMFTLNLETRRELSESNLETRRELTAAIERVGDRIEGRIQALDSRLSAEFRSADETFRDHERRIAALERD